MTDPRLQIGIPVGFNGEKYLLFLLDSIEKTISRNFEYEYLIGINSREVDYPYLCEQAKSRNLSEKIKFIIEYNDEGSVSKGHGKCLDNIFRRMTATHGVFFDVDVGLLAMGWDKLMLAKLDNKNIIVGSAYHQKDGKIVNFPNVITCMFDIPIFRELQIKFTPSLEKIKCDSKQAQYYGVYPGTQVFLDTGCQIAETIRKNGYEGIPMPIVALRYPDTHPYMKFISIGARGEEYQLDGIPISTHVGRSSSRNFDHDPIIVEWRKRVERWLNTIC